MRDKVYLAGGLVAAAALLIAERHLLPGEALLTWGLAFGGATGFAVLATALYRVQLELKKSRSELVRSQAELDFALEVQQELFPKRFPAAAGLEFSGVCIPARGIGGDYYDVLEFSDGRIVFAIADVSGKGISAALLMSNLQALLRALAESSQSPAEVCSRLNNHLYRVTEAARFATFFYAEWSCATRTLRYVNAGHHPPIFLARIEYELNHGGLPLGLFSDAEFQMGECRLDPGDLMVLYSDGITEKGESKGMEFGHRRLHEMVQAQRAKPLLEIQQSVLEAVRQWQGSELEDDMTMVLVRALGSGQ